MDGSPQAVRKVCHAHAAHGTTTLFPTTTTGSEDQIHAMLDSCRQEQQNWRPDRGARIGGVHLYGPYFAPDKVGCHKQSGARSPTTAESQRYFRSAMIKIATCAAELPGAANFYRQAHRHGCFITCGHSNSTWSEMQAAFDAGMRHVDHFWCAMSSVASIRNRLGVPMQGSMLEFVLAQPEMSTEVIADGMHLAPELLRFAWQMKSARRLCLVTDCNRALDMPPGRYRFGAKKDGSWFRSDGKVGWAPGGSLASSVMGMDHMVKTMHQKAKIPLQEAVRMASLTPAERVGIDDQVGSLDVGKQADLLILSRRLKVRQVYLQGSAVA
jgi:N-acetylglucosamine-6-phosphate deacetylase